MKKAVLKDEIGRLTGETYRLERELDSNRAESKRLAEEVEHLKANWRPVPMTHEWQPRNPQCALCDDPRDSPRHRAAAPSDAPPLGPNGSVIPHN